MAEYWDSNWEDEEWLKRQNAVTLQSVYNKAVKAGKDITKVGSIIGQLLQKIEAEKSYNNFGMYSTLALVQYMKANDPAQTNAEYNKYRKAFGDILEARLKEYSEDEHYKSTGRLKYINHELEVMILGKTSELLERTETADIQAVLDSITADRLENDFGILSTSRSISSRSLTAIIHGERFGCYDDVPVDKRNAVIALIARQGGLEMAVANDRALDSVFSEVKTDDIFDASKTILDAIKFSNVDAATAIVLKEQLQANALARASHEILKNPLFLHQNPTQDDIQNAYKEYANQHLQRSLVLAGLASGKEVAGLLKDVVYDKTTGQVVYKGKPENNIDATTIYNILNGTTEINPLAVSLDTYELDNETTAIAEQLKLKKIKPEELKFTAKVSKILKAAKENIIKKGGWKKILANIAMFGGSTLLVSTGIGAAIAAGATIYAGWSAANAWVMPVYDKLNNDMYVGKVKGLKARLAYMKANWGKTQQEKYAEPGFVKRAWIRTVGGLAVGGVTGGIGVIGNAGTWLATLGRQGTMAGGKGLSLISSLLGRKKAKNHLSENYNVRAYSALQTYEGYVKQDTVALASVVGAALVGDIWRLDGEMEGPIHTTLDKIGSDTRAINEEIAQQVNDEGAEAAELVKANNVLSEELRARYRMQSPTDRPDSMVNNLDSLKTIKLDSLTTLDSNTVDILKGLQELNLDSLDTAGLDSAEVASVREALTNLQNINLDSLSTESADSVKTILASLQHIEVSVTEVANSAEILTQSLDAVKDLDISTITTEELEKLKPTLEDLQKLDVTKLDATALNLDATELENLTKVVEATKALDLTNMESVDLESVKSTLTTLQSVDINAPEVPDYTFDSSKLSDVEKRMYLNSANKWDNNALENRLAALEKEGTTLTPEIKQAVETAFANDANGKAIVEQFYQAIESGKVESIPEGMSPVEYVDKLTRLTQLAPYAQREAIDIMIKELSCENFVPTADQIATVKAALKTIVYEKGSMECVIEDANGNLCLSKTSMFGQYVGPQQMVKMEVEGVVKELPLRTANITTGLDREVNCGENTAKIISTYETHSVDCGCSNNADIHNEESVINAEQADISSELQGTGYEHKEIKVNFADPRSEVDAAYSENNGNAQVEGNLSGQENLTYMRLNKDGQVVLFHDSATMLDASGNPVEFKLFGNGNGVETHHDVVVNIDQSIVNKLKVSAITNENGVLTMEYGKHVRIEVEQETGTTHLFMQGHEVHVDTDTAGRLVEKMRSDLSSNDVKGVSLVATAETEQNHDQLVAGLEEHGLTNKFSRHLENYEERIGGIIGKSAKGVRDGAPTIIGGTPDLTEITLGDSQESALATALESNGVSFQEVKDGQYVFTVKGVDGLETVSLPTLQHVEITDSATSVSEDGNTYTITVNAEENPMTISCIKGENGLEISITDKEGNEMYLDPKSQQAFGTLIKNELESHGEKIGTIDLNPYPKGSLGEKLMGVKVAHDAAVAARAAAGNGR